MDDLKLQQIKDYISAASDSSKVYIGCDSEMFIKNKQRYATFYTVVVIHINQRNGCKIFGDKSIEIDYGKNRKKPSYRLMQEVYKASAMYLSIADVLGDKEVEIHLDINTERRHASSVILEQAIGYVKGTCNIIPMVKPNSWAASHAADRLLKGVM